MRHLELSKIYWKNHLKSDDLAIDATCGNGWDTLFLASICQVIGLDIQKEAIEKTQALLDLHEKKATLLLLSHEKIDEIPRSKPPQLIVYNLGYLPKGDKSITTKVDSTCQSIQKGLHLIAEQGALSITCYPGHEEGEKEQKALLHLAQSLPSAQWRVSFHQWVNAFKSPSFIWIERLYKSR